MSPGCFTIIIGVLLLLTSGVIFGEVVEEETWYDASGKVVKTVKRTYSGADATGGTDWEPSWIAREQEQARRLRGGSANYRSGSRYYRGGIYSWYPVSGFSSGRPSCHVPYRRGFAFSYRGNRWSASFGRGCGIIAY